MKYLSYGERAFLRGHLNRVRHVTLDPDGPGVVRIHLIPCTKPDRDTPFVAILNGQDILPLNLSWAILLTNLIEALQPHAGTELKDSDWSAINAQAVAAAHPADLAGPVRPPHGRAPPHGPDDLHDGEGQRLALQSKMFALLRRQPAPFRRARNGHRPVAGGD